MWGDFRGGGDGSGRSGGGGDTFLEYVLNTSPSMLEAFLHIAMLKLHLLSSQEVLILPLFFLV